jgi:O-antigen/teichoic acid export membrane protein
MGSARVAATLLQFGAFAVIAGSLGPDRFGAYAFALATFGIFHYLSDFGFQRAVVRETAQDPERESELFSHLLYVRVLGGCGAYGILALFLTVIDFTHLQRSTALVIGTLLVLLAAEAARVPLEVRLRLGWPAVLDVVEAALLLGGFVVLAADGAGPVSFAWWYVFVNALNAALLVPLALRQVRPRWHPRPALLREIAVAGTPLGLAALVGTVYFGLDTIILAAVKSSADVGQYGAAYRVFATVLIVPGIITTVATPVLSRGVTDGTAVLARRFHRLTHLMTLLAIPVVVGGAMTAWRALPEIPGFSEYEGGGVALSILLPAAGAVYLATIAQTVLVAARRQRSLLVLNVAGLVIGVLLYFALILPFSYVGAAVATLLTEVGVAVGSFVVTRREASVRLDRDRSAVVTALALAAVLVPGYLLPPLVQVAIGAVCYLPLAVALGALRWHHLAGLLTTEGPRATIAASPTGDAAAAALAADEPGNRHVPATSPSAILEALRGVSSCRIVITDTVGPAVAFAARRARCGRVTVCDPTGAPIVPPGGPLRRWVWRLLLDEHPAGGPGSDPEGAR